jgi:hypothetical protein
VPYYGNVATIFGNSVATRPFANTSNEPFSIDVGDTAQKDGVNFGAASSAVKKNDTRHL